MARSTIIVCPTYRSCTIWADRLETPPDTLMVSNFTSQEAMLPTSNVYVYDFANLSAALQSTIRRAYESGSVVMDIRKDYVPGG